MFERENGTKGQKYERKKNALLESRSCRFKLFHSFQHSSFLTHLVLVTEMLAENESEKGNSSNLDEHIYGIESHQH